MDLKLSPTAVVFLIIGLAVIAWTMWAYLTNPEESLPPSDLVACTLEAKLCPDGSARGRVPPDCEFAPCPNELDY